VDPDQTSDPTPDPILDPTQDPTPDQTPFFSDFKNAIKKFHIIFLEHTHRHISFSL
jgi:hypothetical protein